jgi:hypothetical protein
MDKEAFKAKLAQKLPPEERKRMREVCQVKDVKNKLVYRGKGEINGMPFNIMNCEDSQVYIQDFH